MIVKLRNEGTSKGLSDNSVVHNKKELKKQSEFLFDRYDNSPLIIEKLITGKEITVPIIGNSPVEVFPSVQCSIKDQLDLGEMIYTYEISSPLAGDKPCNHTAAANTRSAMRLRNGPVPARRRIGSGPNLPRGGFELRYFSTYLRCELRRI